MVARRAKGPSALDLSSVQGGYDEARVASWSGFYHWSSWQACRLLRGPGQQTRTKCAWKVFLRGDGALRCPAVTDLALAARIGRSGKPSIMYRHSVARAIPSKRLLMPEDGRVTPCARITSADFYDTQDAY